MHIVHRLFQHIDAEAADRALFQRQSCIRIASRQRIRGFSPVGKHNNQSLWVLLYVDLNTYLTAFQTVGMSSPPCILSDFYYPRFLIWQAPRHGFSSYPKTSGAALSAPAKKTGAAASTGRLLHRFHFSEYMLDGLSSMSGSFGSARSRNRTMPSGTGILYSTPVSPRAISLFVP